MIDEGGFELVAELNEKLVSGIWVNNIFIFITTTN